MGAALIKSCGNREPVTYVPIHQRCCYIRSLAELIRFGVKHPIQGFLDNICHHCVQVSFYFALVDGDDLSACGWIFAG